ncbi:hypothetical protein BHM03_00007709 [Ensete ventricosum]|uniref:Uncharacterized protein n=1 Tax=Ensete ventricosum TaxID=4639 RepID=A0A445MC39_ENSVE|nr:hypothetical protein BHM03_00007709 [Ensete ventricosum]
MGIEGEGRQRLLCSASVAEGDTQLRGSTEGRSWRGGARAELTEIRSQSSRSAARALREQCGQRSSSRSSGRCLPRRLLVESAATTTMVVMVEEEESRRERHFLTSARDRGQWRGEPKGVPLPHFRSRSGTVERSLQSRQGGRRQRHPQEICGRMTVLSFDSKENR